MRLFNAAVRANIEQMQSGGFCAINQTEGLRDIALRSPWQPVEGMHMECRMRRVLTQAGNRCANRLLRVVWELLKAAQKSAVDLNMIWKIEGVLTHVDATFHAHSKKETSPTESIRNFGHQTNHFWGPILPSRCDEQEKSINLSQGKTSSYTIAIWRVELLRKAEPRKMGGPTLDIAIFGVNRITFLDQSKLSGKNWEVHIYSANFGGDYYSSVGPM